MSLFEGLCNLFIQVHLLLNLVQPGHLWSRPVGYSYSCIESETILKLQ